MSLDLPVGMKIKIVNTMAKYNRLVEESSLIRKEMTQFVFYYRDHLMSSIQKKINGLCLFA